MSRLPLHPLCAAFPLMSDVDLEDLVLDIRVNGLREPIVTHEGKVIDGQNRQEACIRAGVKPSYVEFRGGDLIAFVISANMRRRHLTDGQRALIAANLANVQFGDNQHTKGGSENLPTQPVSQSKAAKLLDVSTRSVGDAKAVLDSGDAKLIEAVRTNQKSVSKAAKEIRSNKPKIVASSKLSSDSKYDIIILDVNVLLLQRPTVQRKIISDISSSIGKRCYVFIQCTPAMLPYSFEYDTSLLLPCLWSICV